MMPTFDFVNLVKRAVKAALATVTGRTVAAIGFAAALTSTFSALGLSDFCYRYLPDIGEGWQVLIFDYIENNFHHEIFFIFLYSVAGDIALHFLDNFLDLIQFLVVELPIFFVSLIPSIWLIQILRGGRKDINDAVS